MKYWLQFLLSLSLLVVLDTAYSQQVISSSGKFYTNSQGSLSVTIGQPFVSTVSNGTINLILTQGFQQPSNQNIVPLQLIQFTGNRTANEAKLQWKVLNEIDITTYTLQRSADGRIFENVGIINAKNNAAPENSYNFTDANAGKNTVYYKLLIHEKNGSSQVSWILCLTAKAEQIKVYPIPITNSLTVDILQSQASKKNIQLMDISGKVYFTKTYSLVIGRNNIIIDVKNLLAGTYFLVGLNETSIKVIKE
jgi:hypothetical protein